MSRSFRDLLKLSTPVLLSAALLSGCGSGSSGSADLDSGGGPPVTQPPPPCVFRRSGRRGEVRDARSFEAIGDVPQQPRQMARSGISRYELRAVHCRREVCDCQFGHTVEQRLR